jgi:hypothetical protein
MRRGGAVSLVRVATGEPREEHLSVLYCTELFAKERCAVYLCTVSIDNPHQEYHDPPFANAPETIISSREDYGGSHQGAVSAGFKVGVYLLHVFWYFKASEDRYPNRHNPGQDVCTRELWAMVYRGHEP